jgi:hypothetical protein
MEPRPKTFCSIIFSSIFFLGQFGFPQKGAEKIFFKITAEAAAKGRRTSTGYAALPAVGKAYNEISYTIIWRLTL